jgi:hypothetical protein
MDESQKEAARSLLKRAFRLLKRITLVPADKPGELIPMLSPADLWRQAPSLILATCDLATKLDYVDTDPDAIAIIGEIGQMIDAQHAPATPAKEPVS